jgi:hypothetical protein
MLGRHSAAALGACSLAITAFLVACGGGGGGGASTPPVNPSGGGPTPSTSSSPSAGSSPAISGSLVTGSSDTALASGSTVTVTCGCSGEAGETTTAAGGSYSIGATLNALPSSPAPYQIVPGRNYVIVGYQNGSSLQAWTMEFAGKTSATNLNLSNTPTNLTANTSDTAATAAALYIYYEASTLQKGNTDQTFDLFNFNAVAAWAQHLRGGSGLSSAESGFMSDITAAQASNQSMFPGTILPDWDPNSGTYGLNAKLTTDIQTIASAGSSADATLPTPCPGGAGTCTGTPTP